MEIESRMCKCGCGQITNPGREWIRGHHRRGQVASEESKLKMSLAKKGKRCGKDHPMYGKKGKDNPNFGRKTSEETKRKLSTIALERFVDKENHPMYGKQKSNETKKRSSDLCKERYANPENHPSYGKKRSKEQNKNNAEAQKKLCKDPERIMQMKEIGKNCWKDPEFVRKQMLARNRTTQNKKEKQLEIILNNLFPNQYKFVGGGELIIDGKCPDFVNCNGQKKIVELFGDYWHKGDDPQDRIDIFTPFGYSTLVIWEHELTSKIDVEKKLTDFHRS